MADASLAAGHRRAPVGPQRLGGPQRDDGIKAEWSRSCPNVAAFGGVYRIMRYFSFFICDRGRGRELGGGYIRARSANEALQAVPYPDLDLTPLPDGSRWPAHASGPVAWEYRSPVLCQ